jgi:hypothetical protein
MRQPKRQGHVTRGKTALNRLRQVDIYALLAWAGALTGGTPLVVDVGYGAQAWTALEMLERWQTHNPRLRLLGVEIDAERVKNAQAHAVEGKIAFALGGFNVADLVGKGQARLIRAYNVLRQYDEADVADALATMGSALEEGGLLIEGTSTPSGRMVAFDVYQRVHGDLVHRELVFGTNFKGSVTPADFQTILPKRLIHHMRDAPLAGFFGAWERAFTLALAMGARTPRRRWHTAAGLLSTRFAYPIDTRPRITRRGFLVLRHPLL